jgi:hypothetical protein
MKIQLVYRTHTRYTANILVSVNDAEMSKMRNNEKLLLWLEKNCIKSDTCLNKARELYKCYKIEVKVIRD